MGTRAVDVPRCPLAKALTWSNISWMLWGIHSMVLTIPGFPCLLPLTNIISARLPLGYLLMRMRVARGPIPPSRVKLLICQSMAGPALRPPSGLFKRRVARMPPRFLICQSMAGPALGPRVACSRGRWPKCHRP